jgi:AcrR family transcriptional regulator
LATSRNKKASEVPKARVPQQERSRQTRKRIVDAAAVLFDKVGYDAATSADIARDAGVAVGSLYAYFPDKRAILLEILDEYVKQVEGAIVGEYLQVPRWEASEARGIIRSAVGFLFDYVQQLPGLQREILFRAGSDPEIARVLARVEGHITEVLRGLIAAIQEMKAADVRVRDPGVAAFVVYHSVEACCQHLLWQRRPKAEVELFAGEVAEMVSRYLLKDR